MILTAKLKNKAATWSAFARYRVGDPAFVGSDYFINISGINSVVTNTANWFKISNFANSGALEIDKTAGDIGGTNPNYTLNLSGLGLPAFPVSIRGYVDISATGAWQPFDTSNYNPVTGILSGLNSPTDFPSQLIKLFVI